MLSLANIFGDDLIIQYICDVLDLDYEEIKDKLPTDEAAVVDDVQKKLDSVITDGGGAGE